MADLETAAGKQAVLSARRHRQSQVSSSSPSVFDVNNDHHPPTHTHPQEAVLQVRLDVRGAALRFPLPHQLRQFKNSPAGPRQGGAVDPGGHPVQDPLSASQVGGASHAGLSASVRLS